jgi:hypothetical protein
VNETYLAQEAESHQNPSQYLLEFSAIVLLEDLTNPYVLIHIIYPLPFVKRSLCLEKYFAQGLSAQFENKPEVFGIFNGSKHSTERYKSRVTLNHEVRCAIGLKKLSVQLQLLHPTF